MENWDELTLTLLKEIIANKQVKKLREIFEEVNIVDLAEMAEQCTLSEVLFVFKTVKKEVTADLFAYLSLDKQEELIKTFTGPEIKSILDNLYLDDVVDFLEEMPESIVKKVLHNATSDQRVEINQLLSYAPNSAGSIMTTDYVELFEHHSVEEAMEQIRKQGKTAETINTCFVINKSNTLLGSITLRDILFASDDMEIGEIMDADIVAVTTGDDQEEVGHIFQKYDISVVGVVNSQFKLVGIITVDDVIDVLEEEATEDIHLMAGIRPVEGSYLESNVWEIFKSRIPWLLILMIPATLTGMIIAGNSAILLIVPSLVNFIPMLMDTAGNAGSQASAMVIRGIVVDDLSIKDFLAVLFKELRASFITGLILFVINTLRIVIFMPNIGLTVAILVSFTVFLTITLANLIGGLLPLFALILKIDPASMSGPVITTLVDAVSLLVYFTIAIAVLG